MKNIDHNRSVLRRFKILFVFKSFEIAADHFIGKFFKGLHFGDLGSKEPGFKKMLCFPGYCFIFFNKPGCSSTHSHFTCFLHREFMQGNTAAQVKYSFYRGRNKCCKMYSWHWRKLSIVISCFHAAWIMPLCFRDEIKNQRDYSKGIFTTLACSNLSLTLMNIFISIAE